MLLLRMCQASKNPAVSSFVLVKNHIEEKKIKANNFAVQDPSIEAKIVPAVKAVESIEQAFNTHTSRLRHSRRFRRLFFGKCLQNS